MKYRLALLTLAFSLLLPFAADAAISISNMAVSEKSKPFHVDFLNAGKIPTTDQTRFNFAVTDIKDASAISYWKIRAWCEKRVSLSLGGLEGNRCNNAANIKIPANQFALTLDNPSGKTTAFHFKLKAYDKNGKWIHSERQAFHWK